MITDILLGDSTVQLCQLFGREEDRILFVNVHEDEVTSIETVEEYAKTTPVHFVRIIHNKTRNISFSYKGKNYVFDPNRIYTREGRKSTMKREGAYSFTASRVVKRFAKALIERVSDSQVIVAMHNNTDVNYSIKSYEPGGDEAANTKDVYVNPDMDPDDFVYTTVRTYYEALKERKVNVILQDNENCVNDGSLSVYCGKKGIPYLNIEAQRGHFTEQLELIRVVMEVLNAGK